MDESRSQPDRILRKRKLVPVAARRLVAGLVLTGCVTLVTLPTSLAQTPVQSAVEAPSNCRAPTPEVSDATWANQPGSPPAVRLMAFEGADQRDRSASQRIASPQVVAWLSAIIRRNLPEDYVDDRKWDRQKEVWDGLDVHREGLRIKTKRKTKMVNAGTWTRYKIALVDPDQNLAIDFHRLEPLSDGRIAFGVTVECPLDVFGRLSQWMRDVQIFSLSANVDAACRLVLEGTVGLRMNLFKLIPDISVEPRVDVAHVGLTHYRVRRISQVGGDFAKLLGEALKKRVDEKLEDYNDKLVDKINQQIEKHNDRLTFSTHDWLQSKLPLTRPKRSDDE